MLPGWHSVSTRGLAALGKVRFMSCQRTRASAPIPPRLVQSWWEYWERWTRATAETCSSITASLACSAMKRSASQVHPKRRRNCYILEKLLIYFLFCFFTTQPLVACFKSCLPLMCPSRGAVQAVPHWWLHHSSVLWNTALHCSQPDVGAEGPC